MTKLFLGFLVFFGTSFAVASSPTDSITEKAPSYEWSPLQAGLDISYTPISYKEYEWLQGTTNQTKGHGVRIATEWIPMGDWAFGKPSVGVAVGFNWFTKAALPGATADFYTLPITPYIGYRMEYFTNQIIIPYGKMGLNYTFTHQDTHFANGKRVNEKPYMAFDTSLGIEFCMNMLDQASVRKLDKSLGINGVFLFAEYSKSRSLGAQWASLSHEEIQMGMRFEF